MKDSGSLYFLQPLSDQVLTIVRILREEGCTKDIIAVVDGEKLSSEKASRVGYSRVQNCTDIKVDNFSGQLVPAGAASTEHLLKESSIVLGSVTMSQNCLLVYDKKKFLQHCHDHALPIPLVYPDFSDIKETDYPIFFKQKYEQGGGVRGLANNVKEVPAEEVDSLVFQEYIDSPGTYGVGFVSVDGEVEALHCHFEKISQPPQGGSAVLIEKIDEPRLVELTKSIVESLQYSGWGLAEFKYCPKRKDYVFMEVNAKFWASCELAFRNEPKFLKLLFDVDYSGKPSGGLFYLNRALGIGPLMALRLFWKHRTYRVVRYPGLFRDFLIALLPRLAFVMLKFLKSKFSFG